MASTTFTGQRDHRRDRREHGTASSADAAEMMNCQVALV